LAVAGLFGLDGLLFRTGLYSSVLEPDSSTGLFELTLWRERQAQASNGDNLVATVGNSRFGFSRKFLDQQPVKPAYIFREAGVAGSDVPTWYYMLRELDPTAQRYRAIVFGVDDYDDEDRAFSPDDDIRALHYVITRLRLSDTIQFARSFHTPSIQWTALRGGLLKGIVLQNDIYAFLKDPRKRIEYVRLCRRDYEQTIYNYVETDRNLAGLSIDWSTLNVTYPPSADENQHGTISSFLAHEPDPQTGRLAAFRRAWFGRIIDRYRNSRTKIIFIRLPRGAIPRPANLVKKLSSSIREFASRPNVILVDEHAFDSLEHPELFMDGMHMNRQGIERFSVMLSDEITKILGPAPQPGTAR